MAAALRERPRRSAAPSAMAQPRPGGVGGLEAAEPWAEPPGPEAAAGSGPRRVAEAEEGGGGCSEEDAGRCGAR